MKKLKLLWTICALLGLGASGANAYTISDLTNAGWSEVTSLDDLSSGVDSKVYVLVDAGGATYFVAKGTTDAARPKYVTLANPFSTPGAVWILESRGTNKYAMRNLFSLYYFNSSTNGYEDFMATSWTASGSFDFAYSDSKFGITNSSVVIGQYSPGQYVGPWSDNLTSVTSEQEVACNKAVANAPGFKIYAISRSDYAKQYLSSATTVSPKDATFLLVNPMIYQGGSETTAITGWTATGTTGNSHITQGTGDTRLEAWHWESFSAERSQTVTTLPAGWYSLTASVHSRDNAVPVLFVYSSSTGESVEESIAMPQIEGANPDGQDKTTEKIYVLEDGSLKAGIKITNGGGTWFTGDNFRLTYYGDEATDAQKTALNTAITSAQAHTLGFDNGEYAPYNNTEAITLLNNAITVKNSGSVTGNDYVSATKALNSSTWNANGSDVECVYNGDFSQGSWGLGGWTRTNDWGKNLPSDVQGLTAEILIAAGASTGSAYYNQPGSLQYGNAGVYTMPLKANTIYNLTFKYASWETNSNDGMTVSVLNASDGMAAMVFPENNTQYNASGAFVTKTLVFVTGAAGDYVLTLKNNGNTVMTDVSITKAANQYLEFADGSVPSYAPGTYPSVKITRTLTANRWATAIYPFAVSGVDYLAVFDRYNDATEVMGFSSAAASTANEPFLMKSTDGISEITVSNVAVEAINATDVTYGNASLKGVYATTTVKESDNAYVISENVIYPASETGATVNPYRAYIQVTGTGARSLSFVIDDEETTAIDGIETVKNGNMKVYNLNGQRVEKPGKGLYIVNGKKLLVK